MVSPMKKVWKMTADTVSQPLFVTHADGTTGAGSALRSRGLQYISSCDEVGLGPPISLQLLLVGRPIIQIPEDMLMSQK